MKKFLLKTGIFLLLVFLLDRGLGNTLSYMSEHTSGGYLGHHNYIVHKSQDDILVFGSSRAIHHYNAAMIRDSLGLSCYNCGQDGEGIVLFYGWWQIIKQRHHPKIIIYEVTPGYDVSAHDNAKHLGWLKGLYDYDVIKQEFDDVDTKERYKMQSLLYRYNSKFHQIMIDYMHPIHNITLGYLPVNRELDPLRVRTTEAVKKDNGTKDEIKLDSLRLYYFNDMIQNAGNTKFVFVNSPTWYGNYDHSLDTIKNLAKRYHFEFLDFSHDDKYVHHNEFFYDGSHMNSRGADEFTKDLIIDLRKRKVIE